MRLSSFRTDLLLCASVFEKTPSSPGLELTETVALTSFARCDSAAGTRLREPFLNVFLSQCCSEPTLLA